MAIEFYPLVKFYSHYLQKQMAIEFYPLVKFYSSGIPAENANDYT